MFGFLFNVFSNGKRILSETRVIAGSRKNVSTWTFAFGGAELRILRWHLIWNVIKCSPPFPFLCKLCSLDDNRLGIHKIDDPYELGFDGLPYFLVQSSVFHKNGSKNWN